MDFKGQAVLHPKYGEGKIEEVTEKAIVIVRFTNKTENDGIAKFGCPSAFEKHFLRFKDPKYQLYIENYLRNNPSKKKRVLKPKNSMSKSSTRKKATFYDLKKAITNAYDDLHHLEKPVGSFIDIVHSYPSDYGDPWNQACYVFKYSYAYAFEYYEMFKDIIKWGINSKSIKVLSLGCGTMQDAWALEYALKSENKDIMIDYTGIDKINWNKRYVPINMDGKASFENCNASVYMSSLNYYDFDILVLPKSLGEIPPRDFESILKSFNDYEYIKDTLYIAISLVKFTKENSNNDSNKNRLDRLKNVIAGKGFNFDVKKNIPKSEYILKSFGKIPDGIFNDAERLIGEKMMVTTNYENYYICKFAREQR